MEKKVTISDIAREAGVSKTTISRYLNGNYEYMSAETRQRIEEVIERNEYVPNSIARTLKTKKSRLIGIIANTLRYQVAAQTITAIQDVCIQHGYGTIVYRSNGDPKEESNVIQLCLNQQVEGLIIIPCENSSERYIELCDRGIPVVLCSRYLADWPYGCVYVKHRELILAMMEHLREQGFEKARFLVDVEDFHKQMMAGVFTEYTQTYFGMSPEESVINVGGDSERVRSALLQLMTDYPGKRKAVMAVNTQTLFLTLRELERNGLRTPDDLGVCGYDAIGWSELIYPGISSIRQPMDTAGTRAAEKMMECLRENRLSSGKEALDGQIFFHKSTQIR